MDYLSSIKKASGLHDVLNKQARRDPSRPGLFQRMRDNREQRQDQRAQRRQGGSIQQAPAAQPYQAPAQQAPAAQPYQAPAQQTGQRVNKDGIVWTAKEENGQTVTRDIDGNPIKMPRGPGGQAASGYWDGDTFNAQDITPKPMPDLPDPNLLSDGPEKDKVTAQRNALLPPSIRNYQQQAADYEATLPKSTGTDWTNRRARRATKASGLLDVLNKQAGGPTDAETINFLNDQHQYEVDFLRKNTLSGALKMLLGVGGVGLGVRSLQGLGNLLTRETEEEEEEDTLNSVYALKTSAEDTHPANQKHDRQGRSPYDPNYDPNASHPGASIGGKRVSLPGIRKAILEMARKANRTVGGGLQGIGKAIGRGPAQTAKDVLGIHGVPSKATPKYNPDTRSFLDKSGAMSPMLRNALKTSAEKSADPVLDTQDSAKGFWRGAKWPMLIGGGVAGGVGGWQLMDYLLDKRREEESDDELAQAKEEYETALAGGSKSAADQELGRELDRLFDLCVEKTAGISEEIMSKEGFLDDAMGLYAGAYALPSAALAALLSYPFFSNRQRSVILEKATKQRARNQEAKSPEVIQLQVGAEPKAPELSEETDEDIAEKLEEELKDQPIDISPKLDFEDSLDRV